MEAKANHICYGYTHTFDQIFDTCTKWLYTRSVNASRGSASRLLTLVNGKSKEKEKNPIKDESEAGSSKCTVPIG